MNRIRCGDCANFDEQYRNIQVTHKDGTKANVPQSLWYGNCTAQSIYPSKENEGQVFPLNVRRRDADDSRLPEMKSVEKTKIIESCPYAVKK